MAGMVSPEPKAAKHDAVTTSLSTALAYENILYNAEY